MAKSKSKPRRTVKSKRGGKRASFPVMVTLTPDQETFAARLQSDFLDIGALVVEFSQLEFTIRFALANAIRLDHQYFDVVLSAFDFATLCRVTSAILQQQRPEEKEAIERLYNQCLELNNERVRVAHGLWTLAGGGARVVSRNSFKATYHFTEEGELQRLAAKAQRLMQAVLNFQPRPDGQSAAERKE